MIGKDGGLGIWSTFWAVRNGLGCRTEGKDQGVEMRNIRRDVDDETG